MHDVPYGYCHCGCGQKTRIARQSLTLYGHVKGQPVRYLPGHYAKAAAKTLEDRFWALVDRRGPSECWRWLGRGRAGYGHIWGGAGRPETTVYAHRLAYEMLVGPIPPGLELDHLCRNRGCVNPAHLEPVTHLENLRRSPITTVGKTHCPQGHPYAGDNLYMWRGERQCRTCHRDNERGRRERVRKERKTR